MKMLRVLVVEDDTITGMLLGELLTSMGHDVCAIESTQANAVTAAARCRPDLMIVECVWAMEAVFPPLRKYCALARFPMSSSAATFRVFRR